MPFVKSQPTSLKELIQSINVHVSGKSQYTKFQHMYANDRVAFAFDIFPDITFTGYQIETLAYFDEGNTRIAVRSPHGVGKTLLAAVLTHHTVLTSDTDCKVPTTASAWRQLEKYLWPEIHKMSRLIAWPLVYREPYDTNTELLTHSIKLRGGTVEAFALASDNHVLIEGAHASRLFYVFDEAKTIPRPTWNAAEGAFSNEDLDDADIRAFAISTPGDPSGQFYDIHMQKPGYEDWLVRHITIEEAISAGRVSPRWVENRGRQWGIDSALYQNRVLGEFADDSEEGIIPRSWVMLSNERWRDWDKRGRPTQSGKKTLGVDVARTGEDKTVLACREASVVSDIHIFSKLPTTSTAGHVTRLQNGHAIHIEMDGGLGASVYDMLKEDGIQLLKPIVVSGKTYRKDRSGELSFLNVRAAMWWHLREMLDPDQGEGIALPPNIYLEADLVTPRWFMKRNAVIQLESKKDIKKRLGRSTDYGDAVCLAFWPVSVGGTLW